MEVPGMSHLKTECGPSHSGPMTSVEFNDNHEKVDSLEEDVKAEVIDLVPTAEVLQRNNSCMTNPNSGTSISTHEAVQNGLVDTLSVKKEPDSSSCEYNAIMRSDLQKHTTNEDDLCEVKPRVSDVPPAEPSMAESSQTQEQVSISWGKRPANGGEECFPENVFSLETPPVPLYWTKNEFFRRSHFLQGQTNDSNMNSHDSVVDPMNDTTDKDWIKKEPDNEMPLGGDCGSSLLIDGLSVVDGHAVSRRPLLEIDYADDDFHQSLLSSDSNTPLMSDVKESYTEKLQEAAQLDNHVHHPIYTKESTETDGTSFESSVGNEEVYFEDGPLNHGEFRQRSALVLLDRIHTSEKPFKCSVCDRDFKERYNLVRHEHIHTGEKPFKCSVCDKGFTHGSSLVSHERIHTGEKPFKCSVCDKAFTHGSSLVSHERIHTGEKPFKCSVCDKGFRHKSGLVYHERIHTGEKPFKCSVCDKGFTHGSSLVSHERIHTGEKPFKCSVCDKGFRHKSGLVRHERTHTRKRPFRCSVCDKDFKHWLSLVVHERTHTGKKPFRCSVCDKDFSKRSFCVNHERTHTGKKPFRCSVCDKEFKHRSNLVNHERTHRGEKPFKCSV